MQSIGKLTARAVDYYTQQLNYSIGEDVPVIRPNVPAVDYYASHHSPSRWMGSGLERVGLAVGEPIDEEVFRGLMNHVTPAGESMIRPRACHGKVAAFDHTFSAPKSVSLLYAFGDDKTIGAVVAAHHRAVTEAVSYMEERCSQSRVGTRYRDGDDRWAVRFRSVDSEGYVAAGFDHFTSRANDPQVHTHVVVINRVWAEGGWRALDGKRAYAYAKAGGSVYQAVLRDELTRRLGVAWQPVVNGQADITGFSPELIRHFSTRRTEIIEAVERYRTQHGGEAPRRVWQTFTLETRQPKAYPKGEVAVTREMKDYEVTADVVGCWQRRAADAPEDPAALVRQVVGVGRQPLEPAPKEIAAAAESVVEGMGERQAVFTERDLVAHVAGLYPEGATSQELIEATRELLRSAEGSGQLVSVLPDRESPVMLPEGVVLTADEITVVSDHRQVWTEQRETVRFRALPGETRYTTRLQLQREAAVLAAIGHISPVVVDRRVLEAAIAQRHLTDGQAKAMRHLADLEGRLVAVVGPGGSGKTYAIGVYADAVEAAGHRVIGVATSAAAARKLGVDLGDSWTGTIAMLRHHLDRSQPGLPKETLVIVDEASMVSTRDLAWLVQQVESVDGKLVLLGDPKQLPSIDSGGLFHRIVANRDQVVDDLTLVNQRQRFDLDRTSLSHLRQGKVAQAVRDYAEAGRLHLGRDEYSIKAAMVDAWWNDVQSHGLDQVRMLASRHDHVALLNQLARVRMQQTGQLDGPVIVNRWGFEFSAGDRIVVRDNWYAHSDLRNGQTGTITAIHPNEGSITFQRDLDGNAVELPRRYVDRSVDHGYAQTIHTAQGQTFEATHLYVDVGVKAEHGYTALSRARGETHLWLNDTPGPLVECTHIHGHPYTEDRIESLVRHLNQSVIDLPAHDNGLAVAAASDRQLIEWRSHLTRLIEHSPLVDDVSDQLAAIDIAIEQARTFATKVGTSGSRTQVEHLEGLHEDLAGHAQRRQAWLERNAHVLHQYSAITEEVNHRINARVAAYEIDPPSDLINALGTRPATPQEQETWSRAVEAYTRARLTIGPEADLADPAVLEAIGWRITGGAYHGLDQPARVPMLRLTG